MKCWPALLFSLVLAGLIAAPAAASPTEWDLGPGEHRYEQLYFEGATKLEVDIDLVSGTSVTMLLLDEANFIRYERGEAYGWVHISTTMDRSSLSLDVGAGTWYVVLENTGSDRAQLDVDISWEAAGGDGGIRVDPILLAMLAIIVAAAAVLYYVSIKKKKVKG